MKRAVALAHGARGHGGSGRAFIYGHVKADNVDPQHLLQAGGTPLSSFDVLSCPRCAAGRTLIPTSTCSTRRSNASTRSWAGATRAVRLPRAVHPRRRAGLPAGSSGSNRANSMAQVSAWDLSRVVRGRVLRMPRSLRVLAERPESTRAGLARSAHSPRRRTDRVPAAVRSHLPRGPGHAAAEGPPPTHAPTGARGGAGIVTVFVYADDPVARTAAVLPAGGAALRHGGTSAGQQRAAARTALPGRA